MARSSNRLRGRALLRINGWPSGRAFNTVRPRGRARRAALRSTCAPCYLQIAAFPPRNAPASPLLSWKRLVEAPRIGRLGAPARWPQAQRMAASPLGGSGAQRPHVSICLGCPRPAGNLESMNPNCRGPARARPGRASSGKSLARPVGLSPGCGPGTIPASPGLPVGLPGARGTLETPERQLRSKEPLYCQAFKGLLRRTQREFDLSRFPNWGEKKKSF